MRETPFDGTDCFQVATAEFSFGAKPEVASS
jgi:hypothetical protein